MHNVAMHVVLEPAMMSLCTNTIILVGYGMAHSWAYFFTVAINAHGNSIDSTLACKHLMISHQVPTASATSTIRFCGVAAQE
ncbi:MAG: hypothetical protein JSR71_07455 [Proteobacteria bacterium]|nr:hypothetical protein [Pseudomonadota bacterium]